MMVSSVVGPIERGKGKMGMQLPTSEEWARACAADGEFALAARHWTGGLTLSIGERELDLRLSDGSVAPGKAASAEGLLTYSGPADVWWSRP